MTGWHADRGLLSAKRCSRLERQSAGLRETCPIENARTPLPKSGDSGHFCVWQSSAVAMSDCGRPDSRSSHPSVLRAISFHDCVWPRDSDDRLAKRNRRPATERRDRPALPFETSPFREWPNVEPSGRHHRSPPDCVHSARYSGIGRHQIPFPKRHADARNVRCPKSRSPPVSARPLHIRRRAAWMAPAKTPVHKRCFGETATRRCAKGATLAHRPRSALEPTSARAQFHRVRPAKVPRREHVHWRWMKSSRVIHG